MHPSPVLEREPSVVQRLLHFTMRTSEPCESVLCAIAISADAHLRRYDSVENPAKGNDVPPPEAWTEPELARWLLALASAVRDGASIDPDADLFGQGFDSLSATFLRNGVLGAIRTAIDPAVGTIAAGVSNGFVYAHPSVQSMAAALAALVSQGSADGSAEPDAALKSVQAMIEKYSLDLPKLNAKASEQGPSGHVVLLTGTTGGLGAHLLAALLGDKRVTKVFAYNRPSKASTLSRQQGVFEDRWATLSHLR
jgi:hypothetical protein